MGGETARRNLASSKRAVNPIDDVRVKEYSRYSKEEHLLRCKVASLYRLIDLHGWSAGIYNHITVRIPQTNQFLINPFGLNYSEMTATSLLKVDQNGNVLDRGSTMFGFNEAGYTLHSAIHEGRKDLNCVIHVHTGPAAAVASLKQGLLPISQEALIIGKPAYHDYDGIVLGSKEKAKISKALGSEKKVMILRNHGIVACGETPEEAFHVCYWLMSACEIQVRAMSAGLDNLILLSDEVQEKTHAVASKGAGGVGKGDWGPGELEFESWMRLLDSKGYETGYKYKGPLPVTDVK